MFGLPHRSARLAGTLLVVALAAGCAAPSRVTVPEAPATSLRRLEPGAFVAGRSYVWKLEGNLDARHVDGLLGVDVDVDGSLHVLSRDLPLPANDARELVDTLLPPPEPAERKWTIPGLGSTFSSESPDLERVDRTTRIGATEVQIVREGSAVSRRYKASERGVARARIDPTVPRYAQIDWTFETEATSSLGHEPSQLRATMTVSLVFDPQASRDREKERSRLVQRAKAARDGYSAYVATHDAKRELADARAVLIRTTAETSTPHISFEAVSARYVLSFYMRRDGGAVGHLLLAMPEDARAPFLRALGRGCSSRDVDVLHAMRAGLPSLDVRSAFATCAHEHMRPDLVLLARGHDEIAEDAKKALLSLDRARDPAGSIRSAKTPEALLAIGTDVLRTSEQAHRALPAILEWLERDPELAAQWLEAIARRPFGTDASKWRAYWESHQSLGFDTWLEEAARSDVPAMRVSAYQAMGLRPPTDGAKRALVEGLRDPRTRMAAASALASLADGRGVPALVDTLTSAVPAERAMALLALAPLMPTTLGFNVHDAEPERTAALARIREWAARAGHTVQ